MFAWQDILFLYALLSHFVFANWIGMLLLFNIGQGHLSLHNIFAFAKTI